MLMDVFSSFDMYYSMGVYIGLIPIFLLWTNVFFLYSNLYINLSSIIVLVSSCMGILLKSVINLYSIRTLLMFLWLLFYLLFILSISGLYPFLPSVTSQFVFTMSVSFPLWLLGSMLMLIVVPHKSMSYFVVGQVHVVLSFMLYPLEVVSYMLRPFTLCFRMAANLSSGHVVLTLIGSLLIGMPNMNSQIILFIMSVGFVIFEFIMTFIQSYVFMSLMSLYWTESKTMIESEMIRVSVY